MNGYRGRRPVNLVGCVEITETGISRTKWVGSTQTSSGGSIEVCGPTTVERVVRYALDLALSLRLPFEDPAVEARVNAMRDRRDAFVREVVNEVLNKKEAGDDPTQ